MELGSCFLAYLGISIRPSESSARAGEMKGRMNGSAGPDHEVEVAFSEEKDSLLANTEVSAQARGVLGSGVLGAWRDWSIRRKCSKLNVLYFFLFGSGFLLGAVATLHVMGYFKGGPGLPEQWAAGRGSAPKVAERSPTPKNESVKGLDPVDFGVDLHHNMTDEELFWRASISPHRPGNWDSARSNRKIAFMFLIRDTVPLAPLWEKYFRGGEGLYSIYVHSLPWAKLDVPSTSVFYRRQIPSQIARWGDVSLVEASRRLLANALLDATNERFVLVSESGIPVSNLTTFYNAIIDSPVSFVNSYDSDSRTARGRWTHEMEPEVVVEHWRKGSEWFEVKRSHAVIIVSDVLYYPKFRDFCKPSHCFPDEHYIPTILHIYSEAEIAHFSLTFVDWSHVKGPHPKTFNATTATEGLLKEIVNYRHCPIDGQENQPCFFFARKFSPNALEHLLELAPKVLGIT